MTRLIASYGDSDITDLLSWLADKKIIAIDTETVQEGNSPIKMDLHDSKVVMLQIGDKYDQWIIDTREVDITKLTKVLTSKKIKKIGHNIKYDYNVIKNTFNITMENVYDTMIVEYVLTMGLKVPNGFYSLDKTVQRRLHIDPYGNQLSLFDPFIPKHLRNTIGKEGNFSAAEIHYGATDIRCAYQLYEVQQDLLTEQELHKVAKLENAFVLVAGDMEYNGMPLDIDRWLDLSEWAKDKAAEYENLLKRDYSEIDNWNSATQVKQLFKSLGINTVITDKVKSKKTGQNVTKDSVQELVIKEQASKFPIIDTYLKYKGFKKLHSTYGIKFLKHVSPITDRIHTNFLQILNTGRTASSNPNVQNIVSAKEDFPEGSWWREAFKTSEDNTLVIADYSAQELRILADKAKEPNMLAAFKSGQDLHSLTASKIYNVEVSKKVNAHLRPIGKKINFSVAYGAGVHKISQELKISSKEASKILDNFYLGYPGLAAYFQKCFNNSLRNGYIEVDSLGRKSYISEYDELGKLIKLVELLNRPEDRKKLKTLAEQIQRNSQNYGIQGFAATMSKLAGVILRNKIKGSSAKILLLIHDEYVVECSKLEQEQIRLLVEESMRIAAKTLCKLVDIPADACITSVWNKD